MKRIISLLTIPLLCVACDIFEPLDKLTYYDVVGEGYVYYEETKKPASNAQVIVSATFESGNYYQKTPMKEEYTADSDGYFCVRFLKRTDRTNVFVQHISPDKKNYYSEDAYYIFAKELQKLKGVIQVDTLWLKKSIIPE